MCSLEDLRCDQAYVSSGMFFGTMGPPSASVKGLEETFDPG